MNRIEYYDRMTQVQRTSDYDQWISFFLQAFADSAADAIHTIDQLTALHDKNTKLFGTLTKWQRTRVLKVVSILINDGILAQTDKSGKAKIYSYIEYLDILCKDS